MTCSIIGPGFVGSFLGAAGQACEVVLGPSRRLAAAQVRLPSGELRHWQPTPVRRPGQPTLLCTRLDQVSQHDALPGLRAAQNGLAPRLPTFACFLAVDRDAAGILHHSGPSPRLVTGRLPRSWEPVIRAWREAGIEVDTGSDLRAARWEKCILNATVGPLCRIHGLSIAAVWRRYRARVMSATAEGLALAQAAGVELDEGLLERSCQFFDALGKHVPSAARDGGELPLLFTELLRQAERYACPIPQLRAIAAAILPTTAHFLPLRQ